MTLTNLRMCSGYSLEWALIAISFLFIPNFVNSDCQVHPSFIACLRSLPKLEDLIKAGQAAHVVITEYNGELSTNIPEGYGNYTVKSLQVSKSRITGIQPRFFARFSNNKLGHLTLSAVNGTLYLDSETLGGLEDVLHTLYIVDPVVRDVSYLAKLGRLDSVSLLRTGLTQLPNNFVSLLRRAVKLDLSFNQLTSLPWGEVAKRIQDVTFGELKLTRNKWHCDCSMKPVVEAELEAKRKITNFECHTPADLATLPLQALSVASICPTSPESPVDGWPDSSEKKDNVPVSKDDTRGSGGQTIDSRPDHGTGQQPVGGAKGEEVEIATAGGMSTEVIAVIIAVVVVVAIVLIAVIVFKVRSRNQGRRKPDAEKQPTHKSSAYCSVIEHPNSKSSAHGRNAGTTNSGTAEPPANSYNRDLEDSEKQPLAPPYYPRDPRL